MIQDILCNFCDDQVVSGTDVSTYCYDLGYNRDAVDATTTDIRDIGQGEPLYVWLKISPVSTFSAGDDGNVVVSLVSDSDSALGSATVIQTLATYLSGSMTFTDIAYFAVAPATIADGDRYIGLSFTETSDISPYTVSAGLVNGRPNWRAYNKSASTDLG